MLSAVVGIVARALSHSFQTFSIKQMGKNAENIQLVPAGKETHNGVK